MWQSNFVYFEIQIILFLLIDILINYSYLYTVLADNTLKSIPVIIGCNKQDLPMAKGCNVIEGLLEKEL